MTLAESRQANETSALQVYLRAIISGDHGSCFFLVDGARLGTLSAKLDAVAVAPAVSLLNGGPVSDESSAGPLLYEIDLRRCSDRWIDKTLQSFLETGCLSILTSPRPANELVIHFRAFIDVVLADGTTMVMRFFDPRVLPFWFEILDEERIAYLAEGVDQWAYVNHAMALSWLPLAKAAYEMPVFPMLISTRQEENLLDRCLPYALMDKVTGDEPELMSRVESGSRYELTLFLIRQAREHGFDGMGDFDNYCRLGYEYGRHFDQQRPFAELLHLKRFKHVHEVVAQLTAADWVEMERER